MSQHPLLTILNKACQGLLMPSESEAALEAFLWTNGDGLTPDRLLELTQHEEGTPVETMELTDFFRTVPAEDRPKFNVLAKVLAEHLAGIKVYKLGEVELDVYIVGKTEDGHWAGLKTHVVET